MRDKYANTSRANVLCSSPAQSKPSVRSFLGSFTVVAKAGLSSSSPGSSHA